MMQRAAQSLFAQFLRDLNPDVVRLTPGIELVIFFGRHRQMAAFDGDIAMQSRQKLWIL